jgi:hypothetical protein
MTIDLGVIIAASVSMFGSFYAIHQARRERAIYERERRSYDAEISRLTAALIIAERARTK